MKAVESVTLREPSRRTEGKNRAPAEDFEHKRADIWEISFVREPRKTFIGLDEGVNLDLRLLLNSRIQGHGKEKGRYGGDRLSRVGDVHSIQRTSICIYRIGTG